MNEERRIQLVAEVDTTRTRAGFNEIAQQGESMAAQVTRSGDQAQRSVSNIGTGAGRSAQSVESAQRNIIGSIQRTTAAMQAGSRSGAEYYEVLARQRGVDPAVLAPYLAQLRAVEGAQTQVGMSTRAYSAAMRNVPAQITDIVTSLQGGMPPLTVAIQQGGQLRDMFGGIAPAARALSTQLLGMITPYTLIGAALAAVGIAYYQGSKEADAFRLAVISTGNAAGVTTSQLAGMAKQASAAAGTQGANAEALAALVGTGRVAADQLVAASIAAVSAQKFLGIAVDATVKSFADLGGDPLKAALKLNEQYGYLTLSTYKQIRALEDQGKTSEAAKVAQASYADMLSDRSKKMEGSLGTLEKGWNLLGSSAKAAWDRMLDIGRETSLEDKIKAARQRLADAQKGIAAPPAISTTGMAPSLGFGKGQKETAIQAQKALDALLAQEDREKRLAALEAERNRLSAAGIKWAEDGEQYLTRAQGLQKALNESRERGLAAGESDAEISKRALAIRAQYADVVNAGVESQIAAISRLGAIQEEAAKRTRLILDGEQQSAGTQALDRRVEYAEKAAKLDEEALQREKARIQQRLDLAAREVVSEDQRGAQQQKLADMRGQIALADEQILTRRAQLSKDLTVMDVADTNAAIESQERMLAARQADVDALRGQVRAQRDENAVIGLTTQQAQAMNTQIVEERANRLEVNAAVIATISGREAEAEAMRESARLMRELNAEQVIGANKKESADQWRTAVKQYDEIFRLGFAGMLNNGKSGWSSFTRSLTTTFKTTVADQIYKMLAQPFVVNMVGNILGVTGANGVTGAASSVAGSAASSMAGTAVGGLFGAGGMSGSLMAGAGWLTGSTTLGGALSAGASLVGTGTLGGLASGMGMMVGALGPIALGVAAVVALAKKWDDSGTIHTGGAASASAAGVSNIDARTLGFQNINTADPTKQLTAQLAQSVVAILDSTATTFGKTAGYTAATAFADDTSKDGAWGALIIGNLNGIVSQWGDANSRWAPKVFADGEAGQKEYLADISKSVRAALDGIGMPEWAKSMLDGLGDTPALEELAKVVDTINATQKTLVLMGERLVGFAGLSDTAVSALIKASGGIEGLAANASTYYDNFYSEGEKTAVVTKQVSDALKAVGVEMPATRDGFRAQVEAQLALGAAGAPAAAALLANAQAFASVVPAAEAAAGALRSLQEIESEHVDLQNQLDQLTMTQEQLAAKARAAIDGHNLALYDQVQAAQAAKDAADALASANAGYQQQIDAILKASMTAEQVRAMEIAGMDASTVALYDRLAALKAIAAAETAATAAQAAIAKALTNAVSDAYSNLQSTVGREKDALTAIYQSTADVLQASIDKVSGSVSNLQSLSDALHSTLDSMQIPGQEKAERQAAQAQIEAALAIAKAGGPLPDADSLKNALSIVGRDASGQFGSYLDYQRDLYTTKNNLTGLAGYTDVQLTTEQLTLKAIKDQKAALDEAHKKELAKFDAILDQAKSQIDALNGIRNGIGSIPEALAALATSIKAAYNNPVASAGSVVADAYKQYLGRDATASEVEYWKAEAAKGVNVAGGIAGSDEAKIQDLYRTLLGHFGDATSVDAWEAALATGKTLEQIRAALMDTDEYKKLHSFAVGTNSVPYDMTANIHAGEPIIPAADNRELMRRLSSSGGDSSELIAEMREMRREIAQLRAAADRTADSSETSAGLLKRAIRNDRLYTSTKVEATKEEALA